MEVPSYIKSIISPELRRSVVNRGVIKPGDQLQAQIVDIKANGKVLVDFGKFRSFAEVTFPVARGAVIEVKVIDIGEQIKLKVIDPALKSLPGADDRSGKSGVLSQEDLTKLRSQLKHILDNLAAVSDRHKSPVNLKNTLESIHAHLRPLIISGNREQLAADIKSYLDTSGIFFEKKLEGAVFKALLGAADLTPGKLKEMTRIIAQALENRAGQTTDKLGEAARLQHLLSQDLKPNLFMLKAHLDKNEEIAKWVDQKTLEQIKTTVDKLISDIVGQQTDAANKQGRADLTQVFSFSIPLEETRQNARLKIYYPKKKKDASKEGFRIAVLLDMDRLGEIRTDLHLLEKDLSITFFVQDMQKKIWLENSFQEILQELLPYFDYLSVKAVVAEKKIEEFDGEDHQISSDGMLDVRV